MGNRAGKGDIRLPRADDLSLGEDLLDARMLRTRSSSHPHQRSLRVVRGTLLGLVLKEGQILKEGQKDTNQSDGVP